MSADEVTGEVAEMKVEDGAVADPTTAEQDDDVVDPWKVESKSAKGVDYDKLISKCFGCNKMCELYALKLVLSPR